jgi:hypothetical protein
MSMEEIGENGSSGTPLTTSVSGDTSSGAASGLTKTPQAPQKSADTTSSATSKGATAGSTSAQETPDEPSAPVFTPNYKFKANQKEMEFDEFLRSAVTTPESEKKLRELYEKAYGLDTIKPERDQLKQSHQQLTQEYSQIKGGLDKVSHFVRQKDYESFFQALGIPKSDIMQYALLQIQLQERPEQKAAYEQARQQSATSYDLEQQNQHLQETIRQQANAARRSELDIALQRPEISQTMQAFDQRLGRVGAFRDEVVKRGQYHWHASQMDIPADQAIQEVMNLIGTSLGAQGQPQMANVGEPPQQKPTIPSLKGRGTSPAKKVFKSIADIRQHAKELNNAG